ncbi:MAG TPA: dipicolinate synthase subunit DpsA [Capillimicrobium sp.]|nr:dipicolinate synthase subunit DpsA [Capillimicrobium sp.]
MTDWSSMRIAVVGGDEREREIARLAAATGADVAAYGFPWPEGGIEGVALACSAADALRGADYALFPIPGIAADGSLFAPECPERIVPTADLLAELRDGAAIVLGMADDGLRAAAEQHGIALLEYEHDRELMMLRAPAIVEGALRIAVEHTDVTIHASEVVVVGFGNIGGLLASTLRALGANVTVAARNPVQRADAYAIGARPLPLADLAAEADRFQMVFSAVPAPVVGREVLERLPPGSLVMDLAAPPGGVDLELARELGHRAVWARGLGRRAPITVGASQWSGIRRRIEERELQKVSA